MSQAKLQLSDFVQRDNEVISSATADELFMMNIERGNYHVVSGVGPTIWSLLESPVQISHVVDQLSEIYDIDPQQCEEETISFLDQLLAQRLVKPAHARMASPE